MTFTELSIKAVFVRIYNTLKEYQKENEHSTIDINVIFHIKKKVYYVVFEERILASEGKEILMIQIENGLLLFLQKEIESWFYMSFPVKPLVANFITNEQLISKPLNLKW